MIDPNTQEGGSAIEIPFTLAKAPTLKFKPYGEIIQLDWTPPEKAGGIIIPEKSQAKVGLPFFKIRVIAVGKECKLVKAGDVVLMPMQVILHARYEGGIAYFTSENKILAVVEPVE